MPSPRYWREIPGRYRLEAGRCRSCSKVVVPARSVCPGCRAKDMETIRLSRRGEVITSTIIHVAPTEFAMETPYVVAVVETPEGARLTAQVVDCDPSDILPHTKVNLEFRKVRREGHAGILCYGYKAVPAGEPKPRR